MTGKEAATPSMQPKSRLPEAGLARQGEALRALPSQTGDSKGGGIGRKEEVGGEGVTPQRRKRWAARAPPPLADWKSAVPARPAISGGSSLGAGGLGVVGDCFFLIN